MLNRVCASYVVAILVISYSVAWGQTGGQSFDILIANGKVINGTGNPWFHADIGIRGDTIVEIGDLSGKTAAQTIDAKGLVVSPGFIDVHAHVAYAFNSTDGNAVLNYLIQGVTTVVSGNDGSGTDEIAATKRKWELGGMGVNAAMLVGFIDIRREVLGADYRRLADAGELAAIKSRIRQAMEEGAWGVTTGLEVDRIFYLPEDGEYNTWISTEELIEVTRVVADYGGVYKSHIRDEASKILDAVNEVIRIGEETGVAVNITHLKPVGKDNWGRMKDIVALVDAARARGVMVTADKHPWLQGNPIGPITQLVDVPEGMGRLSELSQAVYSGELSDEELEPLRKAFIGELQSALRDPSKRQQLRESTYEKRPRDPGPVAMWGWHEFRIKKTEKNPALAEKTIAELAELRNLEGFDVLANLVLDEPDMIFASTSMSPEDMRLALSQEWLMISSDGLGFPILEEGGRPQSGHPRPFASQAITLRKFVREEEILSLPEAVAKMSSLPAQYLGIKDRGLLLEGYKADIAIFDSETVRDNSTYADVYHYATGVEYVLVNGKVSIEQGEFKGALNGKVLLKPKK